MNPKQTCQHFFLISLFIFMQACAHHVKNTKNVSTSAQSNTQTGYASWYGPGFHGKKTASGETYNMHKLTAAHKSLPFGSKVKVRRLDNGDSVIVTINDRGPFITGRIIDLSYKAAKKINLNTDGVSQVQIEVLSDTEKNFINNAYPNQYWVQMGYFSVHKNAEKFQKNLKKSNIYSNLDILSANKKRYRVCYGPFSNRAEAEQVLDLVKSKGLDGLVLHNPSK